MKFLQKIKIAKFHLILLKWVSKFQMMVNYKIKIIFNIYQKNLFLN